MSEKLKKLLDDLKTQANPQQATILRRFFKTEKGQYGHGDIFLGIKVPIQRKIAKNFLNLPFPDLTILLNSKVHEHRLVAILIMIDQFKKGDYSQKNKIYKFYLKNYKNINNWDLVDISAPSIVGQWLKDKPKDVLYKLARSKNLWQKRVAIISTFNFIRNGDFDEAFKIIEILIKDDHDLIHKAIGWMLREIGKRDEKKEKDFLNKHCKQMARTTLRYAIEKFNKKERNYYLLCSR
ncbi:MAG: DNA alkylation repair protein [Candidatus Magasanikbacteria bacterium]